MVVYFIHHGLMQVDSELLPSGVLLPYEVYRGALRLDGDTIVNLELLENRDDGGRTGEVSSEMVLFICGVTYVYRPSYDFSDIHNLCFLV